MSNFSNRLKKISVKYPYKKKKKGRGKYRIEQRNGINIEKTLERANDVTSYIVYRFPEKEDPIRLSSQFRACTIYIYLRRGPRLTIADRIDRLFSLSLTLIQGGGEAKDLAIEFGCNRS